MPPAGVTLFAGGLLLLACVWLTRNRRRRAGLVFFGVALVVGLLVGRWSGNQAQTATAVQLLSDLGYSRVEWIVEPNLGHEPAERQILNLTATSFAAAGVEADPDRP